MAFPDPLSSASQAFNTPEDDPHDVNMPATVNSGDILTVVFVPYPSAWPTGPGTPSVTTPSGWTAIASLVQSSNAAAMWLFAKKASGSEGGTTVNFVTSGNGNIPCLCIVTRIDGSTVFSGTITQIIEAAIAEQSSGEPDPPSLTPSWGSADTLWCAACATGDIDTVTGYPTNYSLNQVSVANASPGDPGNTMGSAFRKLAASSENPGTFTVGSNEYVTLTYGIRPSATATGAGPLLRGGSLTHGALIRGGRQVA